MSPNSNGNLYLRILLTTCLLTWPHDAAHAEENAAAQEPQANAPLPPLLLPALMNGANGAQQIATTTPASTLDNDIPEYRKNCFYADEELCLNLLLPLSDNQTVNQKSLNRDTNTCQCLPHPSVTNSWYCCNITHMSMISTCSNVSTWSNLHIRNITLPELDLSNSIYQTLYSLAITDGTITNITKSFSRVSSIKCLNISNNNLSDMSQRGLGSVPNLKFLDISKNKLTRLPKLNQNQNIAVDVSGNERMLCGSLFEAMSRDSFKFVKPDTSYCLENATYSWFNDTANVSITQLEMSRRVQTECPVIPGYGNCTCTSEIMIMVEKRNKLYCSVNCANLGLIELPSKLPENTFSFNVSNNNITSIGKHFHNNPTYQSIVILSADNNQIASMYEFEGTKFMDHFQLLSLRNNALSRLPEYLLTNALDGNGPGRSIFLGGNKLQCDCNSAKVLKPWLLEHSRDIRDYNEILCRNTAHRVMELQEIKVCQSPHDWTDYIHYLIAAEVLLLLALIAKVSYDYWVFKTAGYLPWPASKMPKLPCDWLCES